MDETLLKDYPATWRGILRIALWTIFFLWAAGLAIPKDLKEKVAFDKAVRGKSITSMLPFYADRRLVREDVVFDPKALNIAWICDSSCLVTGADRTILWPDDDDFGFIPEEVVKRLSRLYPSRKIRMYLYAQLGPFPSDGEVLAERVMAAKPDIIIFHVNLIRAYDTFGLPARQNSMLRRSQSYGSGMLFCARYPLR